MISVTLVPVLNDNYSYILTADNGDCAVVDPGDAKPVLRELERQQLLPTIIYNTHHHGDHVAGNRAIKDTYQCKVIGPASELERIQEIDVPVQESTQISFGGEDVTILETPGHTAGHICFYFEKSGLLFSGDTLFVMGCGRLFEGSAEDMHISLTKLKALPPETKIYCGHEYTLANAAFCHHAAPDNEAIAARLKEVKKYRDNGLPTIPSTLQEECETNLFLMAGSTQEFAELRTQKDNF